MPLTLTSVPKVELEELAEAELAPDTVVLVTGVRAHSLPFIVSLDSVDLALCELDAEKQERLCEKRKCGCKRGVYSPVHFTCDGVVGVGSAGLPRVVSDFMVIPDDVRSLVLAQG